MYDHSWDLTKFQLQSSVVLDPSLGLTIESERNHIESIRSSNNLSLASFFDTFRPYTDFETYYDLLETTYPSFIQRFTIGNTFLGTPIPAFQITSPSGPTDKPGIYLEAMQHAREWLAPTNALFIVAQMLERYNSDPTAKRLLDEIEWTLVPIVNIDGYQYTWDSQRLWRKNRRRNSDGTFGVDLNRNWGPASTWCTSGSSRSPSSDTYCGTAPFSEPESKAMASFLDSKRPQIKAGIDFHTYGPLILWPWQYTFDRLPAEDYKLFQDLGGIVESAINSVNGQRYVSEQGSDLYPHSGGFIDYNWEVNGIVAFTVEGRGTSFVVPPSVIVPSGQECYAGVVEVVNFVLREMV